MNFVDRQLQEGEMLVEFHRHYPLSYFIKAIVLFVYFLLPFFFLFPLMEAGVFGKAVFWILLVTAIFLVARFWANVYYNSLIITDLRIIEIHQNGLFEQHVSEVIYEKIQNISYARKGIFQMLFSYGSVFVHSSSQARPIEIKNVRNPRSIREMISRLMDESRAKHVPAALSPRQPYTEQVDASLEQEEGEVVIVDEEEDLGRRS